MMMYVFLCNIFFIFILYYLKPRCIHVVTNVVYMCVHYHHVPHSCTHQFVTVACVLLPGTMYRTIHFFQLIRSFVFSVHEPQQLCMLFLFCFVARTSYCFAPKCFCCPMDSVPWWSTKPRHQRTVRWKRSSQGD